MDINPCEDVIEPGESLIVTLTFVPSEPMILEAAAICEVAGGPNEYIDIKAYSHPIQFQVFPIVINFGFGVSILGIRLFD